MKLIKERICKLLEDIRLLCYPDLIPITSYEMKKVEGTFSGKEKMELDQRMADWQAGRAELLGGYTKEGAPKMADWQAGRAELIGGYMKDGAPELADWQVGGTDGWTVMSEKDVWGGHREFFYFRTKFVVPKNWEGKKVVYELRTGKEGEWDALNPQFLSYVNGKLRHGLDVNHRQILLTECAKAGESFAILLSAYTGDQNFALHLTSECKVLDEKIEGYYYDAHVPYEVMRLLPVDSTEYTNTIKVLNESLNLLDLRKVYSRTFYESLESAHQYLKANYYEKLCGKSEQLVRAVGHTHIDCAWLWTLRTTEDKVVRSFSTVIDLMNQYPEYKFMSSQPQLYKYVKQNAPALFEQIKEKVKAGQWEAEGGMFVEADCNITSGESFVRQFLYGTRFFKEEFGVKNEILWLPDVFGYSAALPQIMKKCGINYFMTTKISWSEFDKMPYDTFLWEGLDGSKVLTHFSPSRDYGAGAIEGGVENEYFTTYNAQLNPSMTKGAWQRYSQKHLNDEVLMSYGYGDGGGGPTKDMIENARRLERGLPGCPRLIQSHAIDFFHQLEADVTGNKYLPTWVGELYLEYHRGTYTSMARNKKYNRKSEYAYQNLEWLASLGQTLLGTAYPREVLDEGWEAILRNQFHDIVPGSSIFEVYEDSKKEYEHILENAKNAADELVQKLAGAMRMDAEGNDEEGRKTDAIAGELGWNDAEGRKADAIARELGWNDVEGRKADAIVGELGWNGAEGRKADAIVGELGWNDAEGRKADAIVGELGWNDAEGRKADTIAENAGYVLILQPNSSSVKAPVLIGDELGIWDKNVNYALLAVEAEESTENESAIAKETHFPLQYVEGKWMAIVEGIPSKGYQLFAVRSLEKQIDLPKLCEKEYIEIQADLPELCENECIEKQVNIPELCKNQCIETPYFRVVLDEKGHFTSIFAKKQQRELIKEGEKANRIISYEDRPHNFDAWDINNYYVEKSWEVDDVQSMEVITDGPVCQIIRIVRSYLDSTITQDLYFYKDLNQIDIRNQIDWKEEHILLRDYFPLDLHATEATYDIQYGNVKRPNHSNTSWDFAKFEVCAHKWLDVSEDNFGVSFLNDCKYGCNVKGSTVGLTMLKGATYPNTEADREQHEFCYSICPHDGDFRKGQTIQKAYQFNNPYQAVQQKQAREGMADFGESGASFQNCGKFRKGLQRNLGGKEDPTILQAYGKHGENAKSSGDKNIRLPGTFSLASVDAENVIIEVIKQAEDGSGLIVRLYECYNRRTTAKLHLAMNVERVYECNLLEEKETELALIKNEITFTIKPYEIKTFLVCEKSDR